jgi:hypothetical protein
VPSMESGSSTTLYITQSLWIFNEPWAFLFQYTWLLDAYPEYFQLHDTHLKKYLRQRCHSMLASTIQSSKLLIQQEDIRRFWLFRFVWKGPPLRSFDVASFPIPYPSLPSFQKMNEAGILQTRPHTGVIY